MTVDELIEDTWTALRPSLFRRAILGRRRCAEIVMHTLAEFPDRELQATGAKEGSGFDRKLRDSLMTRVERRVRHSALDDPGIYGFALMSLIVVWAVSAIVQYLVVQWWKRHFDMAAIRREYGWK